MRVFAPLSLPKRCVLPSVFDVMLDGLAKTGSPRGTLARPYTSLIRNPQRLCHADAPL